MHIILIFLFINNIIADESDAKYIDLLPEKEKQDFLNKIARRILEEVQTRDDRYRTSSEISDEELNKHDDFVRQILEEESKNLRKHDVQDPKISVIPLDKKEENEDRNIDLTLRLNKNSKDTTPARRVFSGYASDDKESFDQGEDEIPKNPTNPSDIDVDIKAKRYRRDGDTVDGNDETTSAPYNDLNIGIINANINSSLDEINSSTQGVTPNVDEFPKTKEVTIHTEVSVENQTKEYKEIPDSYKSEHKNLDEQQPLLEINTTNSVPEVYTTDKVENISETLLPSNSSARISRSRSFNEKATLNDHSNNESNATSLFDSKIINIEVMNVKDVTTDPTTESITTENTETTTNFPLTSTIIITTDDTESTKIPEIVTTELPSKVTNNIKLLYNASTVNNDSMHTSDKVRVNTTENLADNLINALRHNFLDGVVKADESDGKSEKPLYEKNKNNVYVVYEIPANQPPFTKDGKMSKTPHKKYKDGEIEKNKKGSKKETETKEQPFYVPVYNYSPNKAFYNAHNRLGPNDSDDENDDTSKNGVQPKLFEWDYFFSHDFRGIGLENQENNKNQPTRVKNINVLGPTHSIKNVNDEDVSNENYHDKTDGYFRSRCNENDKNTSRSKCKKSVKKYKPRISGKDSHEVEGSKKNLNQMRGIRAIRQFLMEKKLGYIKPPGYNLKQTDKPKEEEEEERKKESEEEERKKESEEEERKEESEEDDKKQDDGTDKYKLRSDIYRINNNHQEPKFIIILPRKKRWIARQTFKTLSDLCDMNMNCLRTSVTKRHRKNFDRLKIIKANQVKPDYDLMKQMADIVGGADVVPIILKIQEMDLKKKIKRKSQFYLGEDNIVDVNVYIDIIEDMIKNNNTALQHFDWLGTTVDLQSAIKKINDMTAAIKYNDEMHPTDLELLKYLIYLYTSAEEQLSNERDALIAKKIREGIRSFLPRNRNKKKNKIITERGLIENRVWLMRMIQKMTIVDKDLKGFQKFLDDLESSLSDLHTAIKYLSMVTKHSDRNWFKNLMLLKQFNRRNSLELLIHIFTTRILELIGNSARKGMEHDYLDYIKNNIDEVLMTEKDLVMLMKLLEELKSLE